MLNVGDTVTTTVDDFKGYRGTVQRIDSGSHHGTAVWYWVLFPDHPWTKGGWLFSFRKRELKGTPHE